MDRAMANKRYLLYQGGILRRDWFSDKLKERNNAQRIINRGGKPVKCI